MTVRKAAVGKKDVAPVGSCRAASTNEHVAIYYSDLKSIEIVVLSPH